MQNVLAIDLSAEPGEALVVRVDKNRLKVLERLPLNTPMKTAEATQDEIPEGGVSLGEKFRATLSSLQRSWTNAYVVVPAKNYFPIDVHLPFRDPKQVDRIVDLEVQDNVPFETDGFLLATHIHEDQAQESQTAVRVNLYSRNELREVLVACKSVDVEPYIVSTADSFAESIALLAPDYVAASSLVFLEHGDALYAVALRNGKALHSRVLRKYEANSPSSDEWLHALRISFLSLESALGAPFEKIFSLCSSVPASLLSQKIGREVERLELAEFMDCSRGQTPTVAALGALFAQDEAPGEPLVNFRAREFSYSPQLKQLLRFARQLAPYLLSTVALFTIFLTTLYYSRELRVSNAKSLLREEVSKTMGRENLTPGMEGNELRAEISQLNTQLADIGAAVQFSALDTMKEISQIFSRVSDREILNVSIRGEHVEIEGLAPSFEHIKKVKDAFQRRKPVRCRIKEDTTNSAGFGKNRYVLRLVCGSK